MFWGGTAGTLAARGVYLRVCVCWCVGCACVWGLLCVVCGVCYWTKLCVVPWELHVLSLIICTTGRHAFFWVRKFPKLENEQEKRRTSESVDY